MGDLVIALGVIGMLLLILRLAISPGRWSLSRRWFPVRESGFGMPDSDMPWRRGAVLAALATAPIAGIAAQAPTGTDVLGVAVMGAVSAVAYRALPSLTGPVLGIAGSITALSRAFTPVCTDPEALRAVTVILVVLLGLAAFFVATLVRVSAILVFVRTSARSLPLAMFGVIDLGVLVGGPFGLDLAGLAGSGVTFAVIVGLYALICIGAGLLPAFTISVLGAALLTAHAVVGLTVGDPCSGRYGVLAATLIGFVAAWTLARRLAR